MTARPPKKYELLPDPGATLKDGTILYRIRALRTFGEVWPVEAGELGGWLQSEDNLSQEGDCWVYSTAMVIEQARVSEDARICSSLIFGQARVSGSCSVYNDAQIGGTSVVTGKLGIVDGDMSFGKDIAIERRPGK